MVARQAPADVEIKQVRRVQQLHDHIATEAVALRGPAHQHPRGVGRVGRAQHRRARRRPGVDVGLAAGEILLFHITLAAQLLGPQRVVGRAEGVGARRGRDRPGDAGQRRARLGGQRRGKRRGAQRGARRHALKPAQEMGGARCHGCRLLMDGGASAKERSARLIAFVHTSSTTSFSLLLVCFRL